MLGGLVPELLCAGSGWRHAGTTDVDVQVDLEVAGKSADAELLYEPRVWPECHPNYYGAFLRDPDGNNVEVVCHIPA